MTIPYISSSRPVSFEIQNNGRILILKDALLNPMTNRFHEIKLVREGWKLFGIDFGGAGTFDGVSDDVIRQVRDTYGIVLKTLNAKPGQVEVSGNKGKTKFVTETPSSGSWLRRTVRQETTSYPLGQKKDDILIAKEDASHFGGKEMTLHDVVNAGIWGSWMQDAALSSAESAAQKEKHTSQPLIKRSAQKRIREKVDPFVRDKQGVQPLPQKEKREVRDSEIHKKKEKPSAVRIEAEKETALPSKTNGNRRKSSRTSAPETEATQRNGKKRKPSGQEYETSPQTQRNGNRRKSSRTSAPETEATQRNGKKRKPSGQEYETSPQTQRNGNRRKSSRTSAPEATQRNGTKRNDYEAARFEPWLRRKRRFEKAQLPFSTLPSIPVYKRKSTPIEAGYDEAAFEERKRRIIEHLDRSSPIPFSSFVDCNLEQKIADPLFRRMSEAIRALALNPKADGPDAKYMHQLLKTWFRAAYHYLDKNSMPGDGYLEFLSDVSKNIKDPKKAEVKAKELYWRHHATIFWMTLIDLFPEEHLAIDPLHKDLSQKTDLNPWFFD